MKAPKRADGGTDKGSIIVGAQTKVRLRVAMDQGWKANEGADEEAPIKDFCCLNFNRDDDIAWTCGFLNTISI